MVQMLINPFTNRFTALQRSQSEIHENSYNDTLLLTKYQY